jgi:hypothetical protein
MDTIPCGLLWSQLDENMLASGSPRPSFRELPLRLPDDVASRPFPANAALWRQSGIPSVGTNFKVYQERVEKSKFDDVLSAS